MGDTGSWEGDLGAALHELKEKDLYRTRRVGEGPTGRYAVVEGRRCLSFCSNDYLGLANHPAVVSALRAGAERWGVGSGASHLISGHTAAHHALEEELADFLGRERVLLFSTGYMANLGVVTALCGRRDTVLEDRLNHASLLDAALLSGARLRRYPHREVAAARRRLAAVRGGRVLLVTDGLFSMDGDLAPLPQLAALAQEEDAWLMVDDAHGIGVLGRGGRGCLERFGLSPAEVPVLVGTLGKAFGVFGAFVAGSEAVIETLIQRARSYIYTTALPPAVAEAARAGLALIREEPWRRERLHTLIRHFRQGVRQLGLELLPSETPIQPLPVGDSRRVLRIGEALRETGIWVGAIRPPTVPRGSARLRITLSACHTEEDVDRLLDALEQVV